MQTLYGFKVKGETMAGYVRTKYSARVFRNKQNLINFKEEFIQILCDPQTLDCFDEKDFAENKIKMEIIEFYLAD